MRAHGDAAMLIELAVLAVLTIGAIATDKIWDAAERPEDEFERAFRQK